MTLSLVVPAHAYLPSHSPSSIFTIYSLNANGAIDAHKMSSIRTSILSHRPHVFVICETKTAKKVSKSLPSHDYDIYEEPGVPADNHHIFKWGVVLGIRKDVQHDPPLPTPPPLRGRAIAVDLTLRALPNSGFRHRFIAAYAPYQKWLHRLGPTQPGAVTDIFWTAVTRWCQSAPDGSWSLAGDVNATLYPSESVSRRDQGDNRFRWFLHDVAGRDLWSLVDDRSPRRDWTCRSRAAEEDQGASIIDRVVTSQTGVTPDCTIAAATHYRDHIPFTDHRPIIATILPVPPFPLTGTPDLTPIRPVPHNPRLRFPSKKEKHRFDTFASLVDAAIARSPSLVHISDFTHIRDDDHWTQIYNEMTPILTESGAQAFGFSCAAKPKTRPPPKPKEASHRYYEIKLIGGALHLLNNPAAMVAPDSRAYLAQFFRDRQDSEDRRTALTSRRRQLRKEAFAIMVQHSRKTAVEADKRRMVAVLHGASSKRLFSSATFQGMPTVLLKPDGSGRLISEPAAVMEAHREYFSNLYKRVPPKNVPKPWMDTPSVREVRHRVEADPFIWPRIATLDSFRLLLRRGNARPSPGPDGWEKWCVKALSDTALSVVVALHNYEVMHSRVPDAVKETRITGLHKRGLMADLQNKRGIGVSNFLHNSPAAFLNMFLAPYAARLGIVPQTQVAAQQGVQTRDLTSFLAGVQCWAFRHKKTVYALQRDQMKGFDYLAPEGFYDAITAYGLPTSIIDLDRSAQANNLCVIRTAYGFTAPIVVDGVTKQGASLSPTKSTFTTSLGHRLVNDLCEGRDGVLRIRTKAAEMGVPHTPDDETELTCTMVEATDDSYIFATSPETLYFICLVLERFQYVYGWLTQWKKTRAYIVGPIPDDPPSSIRFGSVTPTGTDPMQVAEHAVDVELGGLVFMNTKINDPDARADVIRAAIDNFALPAFATRAPLPVIRRAFEQQVIAKARALLSMQPISQESASELDAHIASKIHAMMSFPYCAGRTILMLPVPMHGLGWSSIERINAGLAVEGLARDLNHHIPAYRKMAEVTLADWTCQKNGCTYPLDATGLRKPITMALRSSIPAAWLVAHRVMRESQPQLCLRRTDVSYIWQGDVAITHAVSAMTACDTQMPKVDSRTYAVLARRGITKLHQCGTWVTRASKVFFDPVDPYPGQRQGRADVAPQRWQELRPALQRISMRALFDGCETLLLSRHLRRQRAEADIVRIARLERLRPALLPDGTQPALWASDGSMVPATAARHEHRTVTAAVAGPRTVVMKVTSRAASILHGEVMALVAGTILSRNDEHTLFSDHQNSVRLLDDDSFSGGVDFRIRRANGRSYYRWLLDIRRNGPAPAVVYTRGHQQDESAQTQLNTLADHYATRAQAHIDDVPPAPIPTFSMDPFTYYTADDGWIEGNIREHVAHFHARRTAEGLSGRYRMATWLHDKTPPPDYPYLKNFNAYSAVVQWYARSGQLPSAAVMVARGDKDLQSTTCRMRCGSQLEDDYHIFVACQEFAAMRAEAADSLRQRVARTIAVAELDEHRFQALLQAAEYFYCDSNVIWPLKMSLYYYGQVPDLSSLVPKDLFSTSLERRRFVYKVFVDWHLSSIRLSGRIWGEFARRTAKVFSNKSTG